MITDHDPGDEHVSPAVDPVNGRHLLWPQRTAWYPDVAPVGVVVRCGQFVPLRWAVNVLALTDCIECRAAVTECV